MNYYYYHLCLDLESHLILDRVKPSVEDSNVSIAKVYKFPQFSDKD